MSDETTTVCVWTEDEDGVWVATCGHRFELQDGTPSANGMRFCGACGWRLVEKPYDALAGLGDEDDQDGAP